MNPPVRLVIVMTHPVQYSSPWFRYLERCAGELELHVLYASEPSPEQQGVGFGTRFAWDVPLREGYDSTVARAARARNDFGSKRFWGLDVPEVVPRLLERRPDVVLLNGWHSMTLVRCLLACRSAMIPLLYRGDSHLAGRAGGGFGHVTWRLRTKWLLSRFSAYLSVGRRARDYLRYFAVRKERIFDSPHAVDNDFFRAAAEPFQDPESRSTARRDLGLGRDDFVILYVGKLEAKKRPLDLIRAVARLRGVATVLFVGAGPMESECRDLARRLQVRAHWRGFVNQAGLGTAYALADCLVLPSDWGETWGLVVNEAMATGLPCVVSDRVGCAPDLVEGGVTGEVYPFGEVESLARALDHLLSEKAAGRSRSEACRRKLTAYSFEKASEGLISACRFVVG